MNNLMQNHELILKELTNLCLDITGFKQIRQPKLSDLELAALNLTPSTCLSILNYSCLVS
ncbi:hypothetical protein Barb6XT_02031 [Bacteroidales bacterium Barb6XT]|nr:hypothetical protein Barb6XT_02031 [Bacteroidales bacterium Barb6XT]